VNYDSTKPARLVAPEKETKIAVPVSGGPIAEGETARGDIRYEVNRKTKMPRPTRRAKSGTTKYKDETDNTDSEEGEGTLEPKRAKSYDNTKPAAMKQKGKAMPNAGPQCMSPVETQRKPSTL